eukprot:224993-Chlamydomonas_euryale.AAC.1
MQRQHRAAVCRRLPMPGAAPAAAPAVAPADAPAVAPAVAPADAPAAAEACRGALQGRRRRRRRCRCRGARPTVPPRCWRRSSAAGTPMPRARADVLPLRGGGRRCGCGLAGHRTPHRPPAGRTPGRQRVRQTPQSDQLPQLANDGRRRRPKCRVCGVCGVPKLRVRDSPDRPALVGPVPPLLSPPGGPVPTGSGDTAESGVRPVLCACGGGDGSPPRGAAP